VNYGASTFGNMGSSSGINKSQPSVDDDTKTVDTQIMQVVYVQIYLLSELIIIFGLTLCETLCSSSLLVMHVTARTFRAAVSARQFWPCLSVVLSNYFSI